MLIELEAEVEKQAKLRNHEVILALLRRTNYPSFFVVSSDDTVALIIARHTAVGVDMFPRSSFILEGPGDCWKCIRMEKQIKVIPPKNVKMMEISRIRSEIKKIGLEISDTALI